MKKYIKEEDNINTDTSYLPLNIMIKHIVLLASVDIMGRNDSKQRKVVKIFHI